MLLCVVTAIYREDVSTEIASKPPPKPAHNRVYQVPSLKALHPNHALHVAIKMKMTHYLLVVTALVLQIGNGMTSDKLKRCMQI